MAIFERRAVAEEEFFGIKSKMKRAVIIHTVEQAEHCVKNGLQKNSLLFATHSAVEVYLREKFGVVCRCLSVFATSADSKIMMEKTSIDVDLLLSRLDGEISPLINKQTRLKLLYFKALYGYRGKYHYSSYLFLKFAIEKMVLEHNVHCIATYNSVFNKLISTERTFTEFLNSVFPEIEIQSLEYSTNNLKNKTDWQKKIRLITEISRTIRLIKEKIANKYGFRQKFSDKKKTIVYFEPSYELDFLKDEFGSYNVIFYDVDKGLPNGWEQFSVNCPEICIDTSVIKAEDVLARLFLNDIQELFNRTAKTYIGAALIVQKIHKQFPIQAGIWGGSPIRDFRAIVFEFLLSEKILVIGSQHGGCYGDMWVPWHFDSDFNRCNALLSYGYSEEDLKRLYPNKERIAKVYPVGKIKLSIPQKVFQKIDILYPLTNSLSFFDGGGTRLLPHSLTQRQEEILQFLNSLSGISVCVKLFPHSTFDNCSILLILEKYKNLKIVSSVSLTEYLYKTQPKIVLLDYPSTPLMEVVHLDTEIFLMNDEVAPFEEKALEMLKKRVHYFEETQPLINSLRDFLAGKSEKKRDSTYFEHYIYKPNAKKNALELIHGLINR